MKEGELVEKRVLSAGLHVSTPEPQVLLSVVLIIECAFQVPSNSVAFVPDWFSLYLAHL